MTEIILIKLAMPHTYGDILSDFSKIMRLRNGVSKFNLSQNLFGLSRALLHFFFDNLSGDSCRYKVLCKLLLVLTINSIMT